MNACYFRQPGRLALLLAICLLLASSVLFRLSFSQVIPLTRPEVNISAVGLRFEVHKAEFNLTNKPPLEIPRDWHLVSVSVRNYEGVNYDVFFFQDGEGNVYKILGSGAQDKYFIEVKAVKIVAK